MKKNTIVSLLCSLMLCGGLWTVTFPQLVIPKEAVTIYEENTGIERELTEEEQANLLQLLQQAEPEQIRFRSKIWDWIKGLKGAKQKTDKTEDICQKE